MESDWDLSRVEWVEGGGYCEPNLLPGRAVINQDFTVGPGSTRMYHYGKVMLFMAMFHVTIGILHHPFIREVLRVFKSPL